MFIDIYIECFIVSHGCISYVNVIWFHVVMHMIVKGKGLNMQINMP
jgi:hypothetical protein